MVVANNPHPRRYPFSMRISFEERNLLKQAALAVGCSDAEIARIGLGPLFERLRSETQRDFQSLRPETGHRLSTVELGETVAPEPPQPLNDV